MKIVFTLWAKRDRLNMTIRELSVISGVPRATINAVENNSRMPRFDTVVYLSQALGCDINELFEVYDDAQR